MEPWPNRRATTTAERPAARACFVIVWRRKNPVVPKWLGAPIVAVGQGWGHSWTLYAQWFLSGRGLRNGVPECAAFFWDPQCPEPLAFDLEADRETIRRYHQAIGTADLALKQQQNAADRRQRLLRERPELKNAS